MADDERVPNPGAARRRQLDARVEELAHRLAEVVNSADAVDRQELREYALGLVREETEATDATAAPLPATPRHGTGSNAIAMALVLGLAALPLLLFPPVGLFVLALAVLTGLYGILTVLLPVGRRARSKSDA
ncbi:MAG TPA: hypothetical protein VKW76_10530 [Candidatus Binatia bacterium]|nr:hypothetical protein [Candidatus Binatia bacterium]